MQNDAAKDLCQQLINADAEADVCHPSLSTLFTPISMSSAVGL